MERVAGASRRELTLSALLVIVGWSEPLALKLADPFGDHQIQSHQVRHATEFLKMLQLLDQQLKCLLLHS